ncbi:MAG: hybrid sensor histidine kinase/response regulator, partial [bacterium]|nr:hybrid sensor histidine kinase/response regulator [bacterium]
IEGTFRDTTKRKQAEVENMRLQEQLNHSRRIESVGTLAGGMAHEFNNLMSTIIGNAGMLQTLYIGDDQLDKRVSSILKASNRCADLTQQLLSFSSRQMLNLEKKDINDLIGEQQHIIAKTVGKSIQLEMCLMAETAHVDIDTNMMTQAIMGVVHNARDAMPDGGKLTIKTQTRKENSRIHETGEEHPGPFVCVSIEDTGVGMSEDIIQHIFEPFFTTKGIGKGTGLELSFVYGTVRQHNGWVQVDSAPEKGTTVTINLPVGGIDKKNVK